MIDNQLQRINHLTVPSSADQVETAVVAKMMHPLKDSKLIKFPLANLKRRMKEDQEVQMVAQETLPLLSLACDMLIGELTVRANQVTEQQGRKCIQSKDVI